MSYTINNSRNTIVATVADGTVDTTSTSLALIGKNFINYGEPLNENIVKILENFANSTEPTSKVEGQLWYDTANNVLKFYNATEWKIVGSISGSVGSAPGTPRTGDARWNEGTSQFEVWNGASWAIIGPTSGSLNLAGGLSALSVTTTSNISTPILVVTNSVTVGSLSTPGNISVFGNVMPGATNSYHIGNIATRWQNIQSNFGSFSSISGTLTTAAQTGITSVGTLSGLTVSGTILPSADNTIDIGTGAARFKDVYGVTFSGTATTAKYADLAERYETDVSYPVGTLVMIGGLKEVTRVDEVASEDVWGVVSTNPAYLMNSDAGPDSTHPAIALVGKIPVRVLGPVNKGDPMISAGSGLARSAQTQDEKIVSFGRSLEDSFDSAERLIMVSIK